MKQRVLVGMSGGVDSSVAAWLLCEQGYAVEGLFMKNWEQDDRDGYCAAESDLADARAVCNQLHIPLHEANFSEAYWDRVFVHFLNEYEAGRTPNPDVLCNREIKFSAFLEKAVELGADYIATGHYAKVRHTEQGSMLCKAKDREKDQTYFLHAIEQDALAKSLFPIGAYTKPEIRAFARELGLVTHAKKDSTGICFIGERRFRDFLKEFILARPGDIQSTQGEWLGRHDGLMFYTLGQRQGLKIGGRRGSNDAPWYVVGKETATNTLVVAQGNDHPMLYVNGLMCGPIHWLSGHAPEFPLTLHARTRYRQQEEPCVVSPPMGEQHCVQFASPQRAVTPGQYVVFYDKNTCLGGAVIESVIP